MAFGKLTSSLLLLLFFVLVSGAVAARPARRLTADEGAAAAPVTGLVDAPVAGNADVPAATGAVGSGGAAAGAQIGASTIPVAAGTSASTVGGDHSMVFFMHDILGGTNPSARIVTGIVDNTAVTGQLPFARPNGAVLPLNSGVNVNSGAAGAIDNNNIPFLTGLGGATNVVTSNNNNGVPVFAGGSLPQGATLQKLLFGTMTVVDDELTEAPELGSAAVGRAQGFYIASSEEGVSQTVAVTTMFKEGEFADSISFFGVHRTADSESHLAIVGGTGKFVGAKGFAKVAVVRPGGVAVTTMFKEGEFADSISFFGVHRTADSESHLAIVGGTGKFVGAKGFAKVAVVRPGGVAAMSAAHETDGVETVLQFTVFLMY
ncbi:hypothetical protein ABZP36_027726 [Zizania latifolia]